MIGKVRVRKFVLHLITRGQCSKMGSIFFKYISLSRCPIQMLHKSLCTRNLKNRSEVLVVSFKIDLYWLRDLFYFVKHLLAICRHWRLLQTLNSAFELKDLGMQWHWRVTVLWNGAWLLVHLLPVQQKTHLAAVTTSLLLRSAYLFLSCFLLFTLMTCFAYCHKENVS